MSTKLAAIQDIEYLTKVILLRTKKPTSERLRVLDLVIAAYRDLCLGHVPDGIMWSKETPNSLNIVEFPSDCEIFISVGEPINGQFWPYTRKNDIIITTSTVAGSETQDSDDGEGVDIDDSQALSFAGRGGVNTYGYCTVDEENRRIFLNSQTRSEVVVIYKSGGTLLSGATYIPKKYTEAIIAWVLWKDIEGDDNKVGIAERREMAFNRRIQEVKEREISLEDIVNEIRSTYTQLPTR